ncbi:hypothetical protein PMAYCL1PPCAC_08005, partial [Pristionchus mayeri]
HHHQTLEDIAGEGRAALSISRSHQGISIRRVSMLFESTRIQYEKELNDSLLRSSEDYSSCRFRTADHLENTCKSARSDVTDPTLNANRCSTTPNEVQESFIINKHRSLEKHEACFHRRKLQE